MKVRVVIFSAVAVLLIGIGIYFIQQFERTIDSTPRKSFNAEAAPTSVSKDDTVTNQMDLINVLRIDGTAERKSRGGQWSPMAQGDILSVEDSVRTKEESTLLLGLGTSSTIELNNASEIEVRELSGAVQRLGLVKGRASVDYRANGDRILNIENSDGTIVAKVDEGKFSILNNGRLVAVATETGSVDLSSDGQHVTVPQGMESVAVYGEAPTKPYQISAGAYLKLSAGACRQQNENIAIVRGAVSIGSVVFINKHSIKINTDGSFIASVHLLSKNNKVTMKTTDVWGKTVSRTLVCLKPRVKAPIKKIDIDWGTKGR